MNRRGFVLLSVLWVIVVLSAVGFTAMESAQLGGRATGNRVYLARAEWARAACHEILKARFAAEPAVRQIDTVDLGRGTWCVASLVNPDLRVNLNKATPAELRRLFGVDSLVAVA